MRRAGRDTRAPRHRVASPGFSGLAMQLIASGARALSVPAVLAIIHVKNRL